MGKEEGEVERWQENARGEETYAGKGRGFLKGGSQRQGISRRNQESYPRDKLAPVVRVETGKEEWNIVSGRSPTNE